ncbi:GGDEF domain-containing protein [Fusibacter paucivorans]|uniref:GGDEF domain-containing protein n=1 Tax=Fusibacter paucivorans TaxID=76009 RepID=A0ABS5PJY5_9FIRM|nr:sensor domain-containing diguanylate cyclase [Fusibacter paucivorans]MBS7525404.1 GGDEF domain-containing protein [Fusibacter paucivorans]
MDHMTEHSINRTVHQKTIVTKLTRFVLGIIILQAIIFSVILIVGGVIEQARESAFQLFHDKVTNRRDYVQREMKNSWINFDPYVSNIVEYLPMDSTSPDRFFESAVQDLIAMLRATQVTGAYVILIPEYSRMSNDLKSLPALYLRDYDPLMNSYGDDDIYMLCGPSGLAGQLKLPLDQTWLKTLNVAQADNAFIARPYQNVTTASKAAYYGYWSKPFKLSDNDVAIVTYSMPLFDKSGTLRGIIGIDLTLNYLAEYLPASELQPQDSLGYLIAYRELDERGEFAYYPMIMGGPLQQRMIDSNSALSLKNVDDNLGISELINHEGNEALYASMERIGLYQTNTPFEDEEWYLVGIMRSDYLFSYVNRIRQTLVVSLFVAILIGAIGGIIISIQMTKPIVALAKQVKEGERHREIKFEPTGLAELDALASAVESANQAMMESASRLSKIVDMFELPIGAFEMNMTMNRVYITDHFGEIIGWPEIGEHTEMTPEAFTSVLQAVFTVPEGDSPDVFEIGDRWIRFKKTDNGIGIVMDVTDEILEKRQMILERDHDALTMILNRKGFQWAFERWYASKREGEAALIMLDLDNLKGINDSYGHHWGDQYIIYAVKHLIGMASAENTIIGRRSGDEIVVLLHSFETKAIIRQHLDSFYETLKDSPMSFPNDTWKTVTISAGVMWIESDSMTYEGLLHYADEALYEAKRSGKDHYVESDRIS